jgi:hypothetical protein
MREFWRDFRYAARVLGKNPGVTSIMVFTLALAIGATTAIFSVVYGVLLRPLPYSGADRIMAVNEVNSDGRPARLADPNFDDFRDQSHSFQSIAKYAVQTASISGTAQPTCTTVAAVTPEFLTVFGVEPIMGRDFMASDDKKGAVPVALVSYGYWRQYFGSGQDLSQAHLKINNAVYSVIGVLPAGFRFPNEVDVWLAADTDGESLSRTAHNYFGVGRLKDGVSVAQACADIGGGVTHGSGAGNAHYFDRRGDRNRGGVRGDADGIVAPLRRYGHGSNHLRGRDAVVDRSRAARLLHSRAARDEGRPDDRAAIRVTDTANGNGFRRSGSEDHARTAHRYNRK